MHHFNALTFFSVVALVCAALSWVGEALALSQTRTSAYRAVPLVRALRKLQYAVSPALVLVQCAACFSAVGISSLGWSGQVSWTCLGALIAIYVALAHRTSGMSFETFWQVVALISAAISLVWLLVALKPDAAVALVCVAGTAGALWRRTTLAHERWCVVFYEYM